MRHAQFLGASLQKLPTTKLIAGGNYEVFGLVLPQHKQLQADLVFGVVLPVAQGIQVHRVKVIF